MPEVPALFADTVVLSNFALAGRLDLLLERYRGRLIVTRQVLEEVLAGIEAGHRPLEEIVRQIRASAIGIRELPFDRLTDYRKLRRTLGAGEASTIMMAAAVRAVVATDDRAARQACARKAVKVTGTIGILVALVRDGHLPPAEAERVLEEMVRHGFFSPVRSLAHAVKAGMHA